MDSLLFGIPAEQLVTLANIGWGAVCVLGVVISGYMIYTLPTVNAQLRAKLDVDFFFRPCEPPVGGGFGRVFISHSSKDRDIALKLEAGLDEKGIAAFVSEEILLGLNWAEEIKDAARKAPSAIVVASEASFESIWVWCELGLLMGTFYRQWKLREPMLIKTSGLPQIFFLEPPQKSAEPVPVAKDFHLDCGRFARELLPDADQFVRHQSLPAVDKVVAAVKATVGWGWKDKAPNTNDQEKLNETDVTWKNANKVSWQSVSIYFSTEPRGWILAVLDVDHLRLQHEAPHTGKLNLPKHEREVYFGCRVVRFGTAVADEDNRVWNETKITELKTFRGVDVPYDALESTWSTNPNGRALQIEAKIPVHKYWGTEYLFYAVVRKKDCSDFITEIKALGFALPMHHIQDGGYAIIPLTLPLKRKEYKNVTNGNEVFNRKTVVKPTSDIPVFPWADCRESEKIRELGDSGQWLHNYIFPV